ncbi:winged helix-turn-helix domain-containing protein [Kribbella sp. NPDC006257]|uniref:ArsR/SmtB family transcription factor n=1 Tax=Kribbella sp. NPDC006257 TaxID=3156738 RepID=UPI00339F83C7
MLRIHFTAQDLIRTTLATEPDPLWEVLLSLHLLQDSGAELVYGKWRRQVTQPAPRQHLRRLVELAPARGYSPDFLTPAKAHDNLDEALDTLVSTERTTVLNQVDYLMTRRPATAWTKALATGESGAMKQLGADVRAYHDTAIAPYWPSIRRQVNADRAIRVESMVHHGVEHLLANLHPRVRWQAPVLQILDFVDTDVYLDGRGLRLQPSFFCWQAPTKLRDGNLPPVLVFPTRPAPGELHQGETRTAGSLAALLGRTRAEALAVIGNGKTTSEVAQLCKVSLPAASQQTAVLRGAGLITTRRTGTAVLHELTTLGEDLLNGTGT